MSVATAGPSWSQGRKEVLAWAFGSRALVLATAVVAQRLHWPRGFFGHDEFTHHLGFLGSWDGGWYRTVAAHGYLLVPGQQSNPAFFPLFPMLLRVLHASGASYATSGIVLANFAFVVAVVAFYELGRNLLSEQVARRAAVYAAIFPMGYVFSMAYPESLVFAAIVLSACFALRGRWFAAAAAGALAALARPEGLLYAVPLAAIAYRRRHELSRAERGRALAAVVAPAVTLATYPLYLAWSLHNVHAWNWAERAWGRSFQPTGLITAFAQLPADLGQKPWLTRDLVLAAVYVALLAVAWRAGVPAPWIVTGGLVIVLPLFSGSFTSEGRFGLLVLPVYWGLAILERRGRVAAALPAVCVTLLVVGTLTLPLVFP